MVGGSQHVFQSTLRTGSGRRLALERRQPLCGDQEGWGPISPFRYDFTPCFLDIWILFTAAWGVLLGVGAVWYLLEKRSAQPVRKNWHFYAKLVSKSTLKPTVANFSTVDPRCNNRYDHATGMPANRAMAGNMDQRYPVLDVRCNSRIFGSNIHGSIPRTLAESTAKWSCSFLLDVLRHCVWRETQISCLPGGVQ